MSNIHRRNPLQLQTLESRDLMSADPLPVLLVIADQRDFFYREYNDTRNSILAAGIGVEVAATTTNPSTAHANSGQGGGSGTVVPNIALSTVDASDYSAIVFVGGWGSSMYQYAFNDPNLDGTTDNFYSDSHYNGDPNLNDGLMAPQKIVVNNLINEFLADDKYVAGVCNGVTVLAWARVNGVSPLAGKNVTVPIKDGSSAMMYNGQFYGNGYVMGQYLHVTNNGGLSNSVQGSIGVPGTTTDDVVVDGRIITGSDDFSAAYFGQVIAQKVIEALPPENQFPTDLSLSAATIAENAAAGTAIGSLSSTDPDVADTFTYSLVAGTGSENNASFTIDGNLLKAATSFNFESQTAYSVRIRTTDAGGLTFEKNFTIGVMNVNETPGNLSLSNASVEEAKPVDTHVGQFTATDPDESETLTYSLVAGAGSEGNSSFTIVNNQLRTASVFDRAVQESYTIRVRVTDGGGLSHEEVFTIAIDEVNDAPLLDTVPNLFLGHILRNAVNPTGIPVSDLLQNASDPETPATLGIAITGRFGINGKWEYASAANGPWFPVWSASESGAFLVEGSMFLRFKPALNAVGYAGIRFRAWDGQSGTTADVVNVALNPIAFSTQTETARIAVGTALFDANDRLMLPAIAEDVAAPRYHSARTLLGYLPDEFAVGAKLGLAVTAVEGNGNWQIRVGTTWQTIAGVSGTIARLVKPTDLIRFLPAANWNGDATITYRAWNTTNGLSTAFADSTTQPGFGSEFLTSRMVVTPVNDAPVIDKSIARIFTSESQNVSNLLTGGSDIDSTLAGIAITRVAARGGQWQYRLDINSPWVKITGVSNARALRLDPWAELRFLPDTGVSVANGSFDYKAVDDSTLFVSGSFKPATTTAFSKAIETATFSMGNSAPTFKAGIDPVFPAMISGRRPASLLVGSVLSRMTDTDLGAKKGMAISGTEGNGLWEFSLDGGRTWVAVGDVSTDRVLLRNTDRVRFTPTTGWTGVASLTFAAWDQTTGVAGDRLSGPSDSWSATTLTATLAVNPA